MARCNGCGGVVGRDCFNPQECEWISQSQQDDYNRKAETSLTEVQQLRIEVDELKETVAYLKSLVVPFQHQPKPLSK